MPPPDWTGLNRKVPDWKGLTLKGLTLKGLNLKGPNWTGRARRPCSGKRASGQWSVCWTTRTISTRAGKELTRNEAAVRHRADL